MYEMVNGFILFKIRYHIFLSTCLELYALSRIDIYLKSCPKQIEKYIKEQILWLYYAHYDEEKIMHSTV